MSWKSGIDHLKNAEKVSEQQHRYFDSWVEEISTLSKKIPFLQDLEIKLYTGWPSDKPLSDIMAEKRKRDLERGYTTVGPQRADLHFNLDKIPAKQKLSRGQQKILITVVLIAQARMLEKFSGEKPIFLIDDLESELDHNSIDLLCQLLDEQQSQTFITTLDKQRVNTGLWTVDPRLFHVKHGSFS